MNNVPKAGMLLSVGTTAVLSMLSVAPAQAGKVMLAGLESASSHDGFIVTYHSQTGAGSQSQLARSLSAASKALPVEKGQGVVLAKVRDLAAGPTLVRSSRPLDRTQAERVMQALAADPAVVHVELDRIFHAAWTPNDSRLAEQWGFVGAHGIKATKAWDYSRGAGSVIAILDTGTTNHPDLNANTLGGYDFIGNKVIAGDGSGRDGDPSDPGDYLGSRLSSWHGTTVAGIAAGVTHNAQGGAGTAPEAKLLHARVLGRVDSLSPGGLLSDLVDAIVWSAGGVVSGVPNNAQPAEVINMSLGMSGPCSTTLQNAIDQAVQLGTAVVVSAGNSSSDVANQWPANCANVITVAATNSSGAPAVFTNYGVGVDIAAPGVGILTTSNDGSFAPNQPIYAFTNGTSIAAPHVAGVVALMQSAAVSPLTPSQIKAILKRTATPFASTPSQPMGAGIVNAYHAVLAAARRLVPEAPMSGLSGYEEHWIVEVPAGALDLKITSEGGDGEADLYVRRGIQPTLTQYDCRPFLAGNNESCGWRYPAAGIYHVTLRSRFPGQPFSGVRLSVSWLSGNYAPIAPVDPGLECC